MGGGSWVRGGFQINEVFYQTCVLAGVGGDVSIRYMASIFDSKCRSKTWSKHSTGLIS
jgi:hypothetical protein